MKVCAHLTEDADTDQYQWFSGTGQEYALLCPECKDSIGKHDVELVDVDADRHALIEQAGCWDGIVGTPELLEAPVPIEVVDRESVIEELGAEAVLAAQPVEGDGHWAWVVCTRSGVHRVDLELGQVRATCVFDGSCLGEQPRVQLRVSKDGRYAAVAGIFAQFGQVLDLESGKLVKTLDRGECHHDVTPFSMAFVEHAGRQLLVHPTSWNRLEITDLSSDMLITNRPSIQYQYNVPSPDHYNDYFHGRLLVSPDSRTILDDGWVWHPVGVIYTWSLVAWIEDNVWESEDGPSRRRLACRDYYWGGPVCWIDDRHVAIWGYGRDDDWLLAGVEVWDCAGGQRVKWVYGVEAHGDEQEWRDKMATEGLLYSDVRHLFAVSRPRNKLTIWDVSSGSKRGEISGLAPIAYHRGAGLFLSRGEPGRLRLTQMKIGPN